MRQVSGNPWGWVPPACGDFADRYNWCNINHLLSVKFALRSVRSRINLLSPKGIPKGGDKFYMSCGRYGASHDFCSVFICGICSSASLVSKVREIPNDEHQIAIKFQIENLNLNLNLSLSLVPGFRLPTKLCCSPGYF